MSLKLAAFGTDPSRMPPDFLKNEVAKSGQFAPALPKALPKAFQKPRGRFAAEDM